MLKVLITIAIVLLTGCQEQKPEKVAPSDLSGVWNIEKFGQFTLNSDSTNSFQNVELSVVENKVKISNCKANEEMRFIRDEQYLTNKIGGSLRVVSGDLIESASIPSVVLLRKTQKSDFFNAGKIDIVSKTYGDVSTSESVCFQRIVTNEDAPNYYHFHLSFPYNDFRMEMDIEYIKFSDGKLTNIQSFVLTSPIFIATHNAYTVVVTSGALNLIAISDNAAHFTFDLTALNKKTDFSNSLLGPRIAGSFNIKY